MKPRKYCGTCKNFESDYFGIEQDTCKANEDKFIEGCKSYVDKYLSKE